MAKICKKFSFHDGFLRAKEYFRIGCAIWQVAQKAVITLEFNFLCIFAASSWRWEILSNIGRNCFGIPPLHKVNSVQEASARCFSVQILESYKSHKKNETKNIIPLFFNVSPIDLTFWCFSFCFFVGFARFQILICELQSIWCKLLVLSWL